VDNASGIAVLNEIAESLAKKKHDRDIYFVATTAEESGLLGAYAFAEKPALPLDQIVISLNVDTIAIAPRGSKVAIIGRGTTSLDATVEAVAKKTGRAIESSTDANAFIQRQDGWALAQKGVPALMVGGSFADLELMQKFLGSDYHGPDDELTDKTELGGAADDADLHIALGRYFADARKYKSKKAGE
jgi:Zn-dependent M28 family amino/carboxypeptidase